MVTLESEKSMDMDSASIEIRENWIRSAGCWDESVGKPMIAKLNRI